MSDKKLVSLQNKGIEIASDSGWGFETILIIFESALTDANMHSKAKIVQSWINELNGLTESISGGVNDTSDFTGDNIK